MNKVIISIKNNKWYLIGAGIGILVGVEVANLWYELTKIVLGYLITLKLLETIYSLLALVGLAFIQGAIIIFITKYLFKMFAPNKEKE